MSFLEPMWKSSSFGTFRVTADSRTLSRERATVVYDLESSSGSESIFVLSIECVICLGLIVEAFV
ncbi:uncharacterized protein CC84DRAFT_657044 [Paraphaeosphaeria sporulosa]|uniref:Uncharacterized protein n=1 Tax=Paraphaeosphaeria sporulosa TaxID=1460663 RepID=A0A177CKX7_9PLEO|nr:uncharacterized protein CC84DRAFT_657044 [Paraphaeosphaeria sporulosa]OAG07447.1 hypothetical protein CC84DRAFT_657044 [Paraphaeosphaeria sporulosa]